MAINKDLLNKFIYDIQSFGFTDKTISMVSSKIQIKYPLTKTEAREIIDNINKTKFRYNSINWLPDSNEETIANLFKIETL